MDSDNSIREEGAESVAPEEMMTSGFPPKEEPAAPREEPAAPQEEPAEPQEAGKRNIWRRRRIQRRHGQRSGQ